MSIRHAVVFALAGALWVVACGGAQSNDDDDDGGSTNSTGSGSGGALYPSTCDSACQNMDVCDEIPATEVQACVTDCQTEPWPGNYRECRAVTCGVSEADCESFGVKSCEQACQNMDACDEIPATEVQTCVADCQTEPWPGNYIDCKATTCGASDAQCEGFTGT